MLGLGSLRVLHAYVEDNFSVSALNEYPVHVCYRCSCDGGTESAETCSGQLLYIMATHANLIYLHLWYSPETNCNAFSQFLRVKRGNYTAGHFK